MPQRNVVRELTRVLMLGMAARMMAVNGKSMGVTMAVFSSPFRRTRVLMRNPDRGADNLITNEYRQRLPKVPPQALDGLASGDASRKAAEN